MFLIKFWLIQLIFVFSFLKLALWKYQVYISLVWTFFLLIIANIIKTNSPLSQTNNILYEK